jgi:hypothetical protein
MAGCYARHELIILCSARQDSQPLHLTFSEVLLDNPAGCVNSRAGVPCVCKLSKFIAIIENPMSDLPDALAAAAQRQLGGSLSGAS